MKLSGEIARFPHSPAKFHVPKEIYRHVPVDQQQYSQPS